VHSPLRQRLTAALLAFGPFGILLVALLDSTVIPLPAGVDVLVLTAAVESGNDPQRAYFAAFMAVLGSTAGNIALFLAARHGTAWLIKDVTPSPRAQKFHDWFHRYGLLTVFVPCFTPVIPFPLKVFVVSAGALRTRLSKFILVVLAFPRGLAGLVTDQFMPLIGRLRGGGRGTAGPSPAPVPAPAE